MLKMNQANQFDSTRLIKSVAYFLFMLSLLVGCTDNNAESTSKEHVWKEQTDTLDKAQQVEQVLEDSFQERKSATE